MLTLEERLRGIAALLATFEAPGFQFGAWEGGQEVEPGVVTAGYYALSAEGQAFLDAAYGFGWVMPGFDWTTWQRTSEAAQLTHDENAIASADAEQIAHLVTLLVRSDRFTDGVLASASASGLLLRIVRRAQAMLLEIRQGTRT